MPCSLPVLALRGNRFLRRKYDHHELFEFVDLDLAQRGERVHEVHQIIGVGLQLNVAVTGDQRDELALSCARPCYLAWMHRTGGEADALPGVDTQAVAQRQLTGLPAAAVDELLKTLRRHRFNGDDSGLEFVVQVCTSQFNVAQSAL